jgi:hypothetical protein
MVWYCSDLLLQAEGLIFHPKNQLGFAGACFWTGCSRRVECAFSCPIERRLPIQLVSAFLVFVKREL